MRYLVILLILFSGLLAGQGVGQAFTPASGAAAGAVDSTRLVQDSILQYWNDGIVVGADTLRGGGAGLSEAEVQALVDIEADAREEADYLTSEKYNSTSSKILKSKIEAGEKISVGAGGDSKTQGGSRGPNRLRSLMQSEIGMAGYGYVVLDGGSAPGMNIVNNGGTIHDGGAGFGQYSLSGYAVELSAGNSYGYSIPTTPTVLTHNDRVTVFYLARSGDGTTDITYGGTTVNIDANNAILEKRSVTISGTYGPNAFLIDNVTGSITITDVIFHSDIQTAGVWFHVIGNGGYTSGALKARFHEPLNSVVLDSLKLDHFVLRMGSNDWSADLAPGQLGLNYDTIIADIRQSNPVVELTITGLEDANLNGVQTYTRGEYEKVQSSKAAQYGANYAPLSTIIPTWTQWDSLGYAEDNIHSNSAGGILIGDFLYGVIRGDLRYNGIEAGSSALDGLDPSAVLYTDGAGTVTANLDHMFWDVQNFRFGILNPAPSYTFDLPNSSTNSWRLPGFTMTPSSGLTWDNTLGSGLEGNVVWNISSGNKFETNFIGSSGDGFVISGAVPIQMGNFFRVESTGGLTYDNTAAEGDANFKIDSGNDFNIRLAGGGSSNFRVTWNDQATELLEAHFNKVEFGVGLQLNSMSAGDGSTTGLLYRQTSNNYLREMTWNTIGTNLESSSLATDGQVSLVNDRVSTLEGRVRTGSGSPEGAVTAPPGTIYTNTLGGVGTTLYVKETGTGNTGWIAK
jgi:lysophospholipase L1-like esterase